LGTGTGTASQETCARVAKRDFACDYQADGTCRFVLTFTETGAPSTGTKTLSCQATLPQESVPSEPPPELRPDVVPDAAPDLTKPEPPQESLPELRPEPPIEQPNGDSMPEVPKDAGAGAPVVRVFGGGGDDEVHDLAVDSAGNAYIVGSFTSGTSIGANTLSLASDPTFPASRGGFVAKLNPKGEWAWARQLICKGDCTIRGVTIDAKSGKVFVVGYFTGEITVGSTTSQVTPNTSNKLFVADLSANGRWGGLFTGYSLDDNFLPAQTDGYGIATDATGSVWVAGTFSGNLYLDNSTLKALGATEMFLAKLDSSMKFQFAKQAGSSSGAVVPHDIKVDGSGNLILTGSFEGSTSFGPFILPSGGQKDVFVALYDNGVNVKWTAKGGASQNDAAHGLAVASNGDIYVSGVAKDNAKFKDHAFTTHQDASGRPTSDGFVAKLNSSGKWQWANNIGSKTEVDVANDLVLFGGQVVTILKYMGKVEGTTISGNGSQSTSALLYHDVTGQYVPSSSRGFDALDPRSIATNGKDLYIAGHWNNSLGIDGFTRMGSKGNDIFIWKVK
jgi:hypothetical protein